MKKIITKIVTMLSVVIAIFFTTNSNTANAATPIIGSNIWHNSTTKDQLINFYDLNNSGSINILDLVTAKQHILDSSNGSISIYDVLNLQHYLNTGDTLFDITYAEWDLEEITFESDAIIKEATSGLLLEWAYTNNALCARFLNNRTVTELRFYNFENITSYKCESFIKTENFTICKDNSVVNNCYFIDDEFLVANAYYTNCTSIENQINKDDVIGLRKNDAEQTTTFFVNEGTHINGVILPMEKDAHNMIFTRLYDLGLKFEPSFCVLGKNKKTLKPCIYTNVFCYADFNYLIPNLSPQTLEEFVERNKDIANSLDGELLQYNTVNEKALFIYCDETDDHFPFLQIVEIDPKRRGDADYIVKEWEKNGEKFVLGVAKNRFIWDNSSSFSVG